jgi:hypothetical protein
MSSIARFALRGVELPEANVLLFGFLVNVPWELLQVPFYEDMALIPHWEGIERCLLAALGDAAILVIAYWIVAVVVGRQWLVRPTANALVGFVGAGLSISVPLELLQLGRMQWTYLESMPIVPLLHVGLWPLLQWLCLPPLLVGVLHRQLRTLSPEGARADAGRPRDSSSQQAD